jgi:hypothetical protein
MDKTQKILESIAPKDEKERAIFTQAINKILSDIKDRDQKIIDNNIPLFKANFEQRKDADGFSKDREMRLVAMIPTEMAVIAKRIYGDDVLTNKAKFRKAFVENEEGQYCLTVDPGSI